MAGQANIATAYVQLVPSMKGFQKAISQNMAGVNFNVKGANAAGIKAAGNFKRGFAAVGAVAGVASNVASMAFNTIANSIGGAIARVDTMKAYPRVMQSLGYSANDVADSFKQMDEKLQGLPTTLDQMVAGVQQLAPISGSLSRATKIGLAFNNMAVASGKSVDEQSRAFTQFTQILSKGKPDMQDWHTLQMTMPGQLEQVAHAMLGPTANMQDLYKALQSGAISTDEFADKIVELNEKGGEGFASFEEQARAASGGIGTSITNVMTSVVRAIGDVIDAIGVDNIVGVIEKIKGVVLAIGGAVKGLVNFLKPAAEVFRDVAKVRLDPLVAAFERLKDVAGATESGPLKAVRDCLETITKALAELFAANLTFQGNPFENLEKAATLIRVALARMLGSIIFDLKQKLAEDTSGIGNVLSVAFMGIPKNILEQLQSAFSGLNLGVLVAGAMTAGFAAKLMPFSGVIAKALSPMTGIASKFGGTFVKLLVGPLGRFAPLVTGALSPLGGILGALFSPVTLVIVGIAALAAGFIYLMTTSEQFRSTIMGIVTQIGVALLPVIFILQQALTSFVTQILPVIVGIIQQILPVIGQVIIVIGQILAAIAPIVAMVISLLIPAIMVIINIILQVISVVMSVLIPIISAILSVVQAVMPTIQAIIMAVCMAIQAIIFVVWPVVQSIITGVCNAIKSVVNGQFRAIGAIIQGVMVFIQNIINAVMCVIQGDWSGAWQAVQAAFSGIADGLMNAIGNLVTGFAEGAGHMIDGLVQGLQGGAQAVIDAVLGIANGAIDSFKNFFGIHSPSRLMATQGKFIDAGLIKGVESGKKSVIKAHRSLAQDAYNAFTDASLSNSDLSSTVDFVAGDTSGIAALNRTSIPATVKFDGAISADAQAAQEVKELTRLIKSGAVRIVMDTGSLVGSLAEGMDKALGGMEVARSR